MLISDSKQLGVVERGSEMILADADQYFVRQWGTDDRNGFTDGSCTSPD